MCGIIGILGKQDVAPLLIDGLRRLEYRGYDSAGIATLVNGHIDRRRAEGKLNNLAKVLDKNPIGGTIGIGHTRWATHGVPNEINAHPHATDKVAVVHNGIIENFQELRAELAERGNQFETETDTEVVAHLLSKYLDDGMTPQEAMAEAVGRLEGAFALAIVFSGRHDLMIGARRGSPLAVGYGDGEMYLGSDALALAPLTSEICYLEEGDWVEVRADGATVHDHTNEVVERPIKKTAVDGAMIGKGDYRHFMLKEIYEQPAVVGDTLHALINPSDRTIALPPLPVDPVALPRLTIVACGTSFYAGMIAKYWFEKYARLPVEIDVASEFRYREPPLPAGGATLIISQSGESIDTLAALRHARAEGQTILSIVNVRESSIDRESDGTLYTLAGPEIGVASTKAFTTQLAVLAAMAISFARARGTIDGAEEARLVNALTEIPSKITEVLGHSDAMRDVGAEIMEARDALYLGRGTNHPVAMEGALKLKEISYIHAEGYAAGEMKHGPIALIDEQVPVIVVAPEDQWFEKAASNVQEVHARGGKILFLSNAAGCRKVGRAGDGGIASWFITMPEVDSFASPILYTIPIQLLAYHVAVLKGTDVDQPRNLAKSVTVE